MYSNLTTRYEIGRSNKVVWNLCEDRGTLYVWTFKMVNN